MAKQRKPRKQYRGRDSAVTPQVIKIAAEPKSRLATWWDDHRTTVIIRAVQLLLFGLVLGLILWIF